MNRIDERFAKVKADGRKALITFLTVGDPNMEVSEKAIYTMQEEGVDLIELGVPFSDPAADRRSARAGAAPPAELAHTMSRKAHPPCGASLPCDK